MITVVSRHVITVNLGAEDLLDRGIETEIVEPDNKNRISIVEHEISFD